MANRLSALHLALMALAVLASIPAQPAKAPDCGTLCGRWQLDTAASESLEAKLEAAVAAYREGRTSRWRDGNPKSLREAEEAELRDSLGPISDRPDRDQLREQLLAVLTPPQALQITLAGGDILIGGDDRPARRFSPGVPHARVDSLGTARITTTLTPGLLSISERYDRSREYLESYTVQRADGSLVVIREISRPGLKTLRLRSVYRPG